MLNHDKASKPIILICVVAIAMLAVCAKEKHVPTAINWLNSYEVALQLARQKKQPIMIDFYTDWCGWCERLDDITYIDSLVVSESSKFVSLKLDADRERSVSRRYRVQAFPTILFVGPDGEEIHRVVGFRPPTEFVREMRVALREFNQKYD